MEKVKATAVLYKVTQNYNRYKISGDCLGDIYIPKFFTDKVIEVQLESSRSNNVGE